MLFRPEVCLHLIITCSIKSNVPYIRARFEPGDSYTGNIKYKYKSIIEIIQNITNIMSSESDYPPTGLADSVKKLPEWIQKV